LETKAVDKRALLLDVVNKINKKFGANTVVMLGSDTVRHDTEVIPTQSILLNHALQIGGIPKGRITEVYGPEHSGKTGICLGAVAECQRLGGVVAWLDAESALNLDYAKLLGVDSDNLFYCQPASGEEAINIAEALIRSGGLDLLVIDSVAALVPIAESEAEMEQQFVGTHARLMSKAMRKLVGIVAKNNVALVFVNQIREKVGMLYGNPEVSTGGRALRFFSSVRIEVRRGEDRKEKDNIIGHTLRCRVVKNRLGIPFKRCEFPVYYGKGVDTCYELFELGVQLEVIRRAGSWYSVAGYQGQDEFKLNSRDTFINAIRESPRLFNFIGDRINTLAGRQVVQEAEEYAELVQ
jgi:recombination protein RecA